MSDSCFRLLVLISIRRGLVKLKREVTRLLSIISGLPPSLWLSTHDDIITGRDLECDSECGSGGDTRHGGGGEAGGQLTNIRRGDLHHV